MTKIAKNAPKTTKPAKTEKKAAEAPVKSRSEIAREAALKFWARRRGEQPAKAEKPAKTTKAPKASKEKAKKAA